MYKIHLLCYASELRERLRVHGLAAKIRASCNVELIAACAHRSLLGLNGYVQQ